MKLRYEKLDGLRNLQGKTRRQRDLFFDNFIAPQRRRFNTDVSASYMENAELIPARSTASSEVVHRNPTE
jgi:DNA-binding SARP family transcriptional activator